LSICEQPDKESVKRIIVRYLESVIKVAYNVRGFAVGGAIVLRRPWRRLLHVVIKDKILLHSKIANNQQEQKPNRNKIVDRRFASPPAAAKLFVTGSFIGKSSGLNNSTLRLLKSVMRRRRDEPM
jgi:hypothetical protein